MRTRLKINVTIAETVNEIALSLVENGTFPSLSALVEEAMIRLFRSPDISTIFFPADCYNSIVDVLRERGFVVKNGKMEKTKNGLTIEIRIFRLSNSIVMVPVVWKHGFVVKSLTYRATMELKHVIAEKTGCMSGEYNLI